MTIQDREQLLRYMAEGARSLEDAVAGLTAAEEQHAPPGGWSPLALVEHVAISEPFLLDMVVNGKPVPERPPSDPAKDSVMVARIIGRERRVAAPEPLVPAGRHASVEAALGAFRQTRQESLAFVHSCARDLRNEHALHPVLGLIPSYNCLLLLAMHPARHAAQILETLLRTRPQNGARGQNAPFAG